MKRQFTNQEIAHLLKSVAAAYQIKKEDQFRVLAYQKAADSIERSTVGVKGLWDRGKLNELPGVGPNIASHLNELFENGEVKHFKQIFEGLPSAMFELLQIPGVGAKTAYKLSKELKLNDPVKAITGLEKAAKEGRIQLIEGFGEESEKDILRGITELRGKTTRIVLPRASQIAQEILEWLKKCPQVLRADPLGSLRRQVSTIGDIDIAVASDNPKVVLAHFVAYPYKERVIESGSVTASIKLVSGEHIDLMVQPSSAYGALLQHFTGSKEHNVALREFALKKGMSLSEYGIKKGTKIHEYQSEEDFYHDLGLIWIPPELREDTGEIEAALRSTQGKPGGLPQLIELKDINGDLHLHSDFPIETSHDEGVNSMKDILIKAAALSYEYVGFSEHNPSTSRHNAVEIIDLLKRKQERVEEINYSYEKTSNRRVNQLLTRAFNGLEIDIKPDGELAIPEKGLDFLDYAIVSLHSSFRMPREEMTKRVLRALDHPKVKILGHPTGRKLGERAGVELDWEKIFSFCLEQSKWLEINAWPERLDLPDSLVREAVIRGVKMIICTDSHAATQMNLMRYGVSVARRGWSEKSDIVNTLEYNDFKEMLGGGGEK